MLRRRGESAADPELEDDAARCEKGLSASCRIHVVSQWHSPRPPGPLGGVGASMSGSRAHHAMAGEGTGGGPRTFETWMPFLALANARVERRQDLASMVGNPCEAWGTESRSD